MIISLDYVNTADWLIHTMSQHGVTWKSIWKWWTYFWFIFFFKGHFKIKFTPHHYYSITPQRVTRNTWLIQRSVISTITPLFFTARMFGNDIIGLHQFDMPKKIGIENWRVGCVFLLESRFSLYPTGRNSQKFFSFSCTGIERRRRWLFFFFSS
jgi:hypothetical protein